MKKYDIFISYSRKDTTVAHALCDALRSNDVSYWIDDSIHGSANFLTEIVGKIKECKVVIFIASANSAASEWTQKEILYALKHKKEIIPYKIGEFGFEDNDELDFVFTNIQWVCSVEAVVEALRIKGLTNVSTTPQTAPAPQPQAAPQSTPKPASQAAPSKPVAQSAPSKSADKTYKVGDYYDDGTKQGVVFYVSDDGCHGKIVNIDQESALWCLDKKQRFGRKIFRFGKTVASVADSEKDGKANTDQVMTWGEVDHPAFIWCRLKGDDWYLPAIEELRLLLNDDSVRDAVNRTIAQKGGIELFGKEDDKFYWSSTEYLDGENNCAWCIFMYNGYSRLINKFEELYVRAVAAF